MALPLVTVLNGSLNGTTGNTEQLIAQLRGLLADRVRIETVVLKDLTNFTLLPARLGRSQGFIFATGTYWDSWSSPLQKFFEQTTSLEGTQTWLGKPAATIVTMHSVGGKEVLSRLQGVLSTLGLMIPPMSGMAYSLAAHEALKAEAGDHHADLWQLDDLEVIADNLVAALESSTNWRAWEVDRADPMRRWL